MTGKAESAASYVPEDPTLESLRDAAAGCKGCELWERGTQTVFGEGADGAGLMLVGEQPGDKEDLAGRPFVGPAGALLDHSLQAAGIDRAEVYVTNAVKHFRWVAKGKRRIHQKPNADHIMACKPWLDNEIEVVQPHVIMCLGATAAQTLLGRQFRVTQHRGEFIDWPHEPLITATVHPSSILRNSETREAETELFIRDLTVVRRQLDKNGGR